MWEQRSKSGWDRPAGLSDRCARGSALLAVLWVSAALSAIAFSLATTVRGETDRTSTDLDGLRSYYLATSGLQRAEYELLWSNQMPADKRPIPQGATHADYTFPSGSVRVDIVPEAAKLNINLTPPEQLARLGVALGLDPERAQQIALAIVDWRSSTPLGQETGLDSYYLSLTPSFRPRHASFEEIEELLLVQGITPDIYYGTYVPTPEGSGGLRLAPRPGLVDCLSVYGSTGRVDVNTANPAVMAALGVPPDVIGAIVERRRSAPFTNQQLGDFSQAYGLDTSHLRVGGANAFTLRATARIRLANGQLSDLRRSVAAQIKYAAAPTDPPVSTLRWYDTAGSN
jgi:general secretion pathway protein K